MRKRASGVGRLGSDASLAARRRRSNPEYDAFERRHAQSLAIADLVILHRTRQGLTQHELAERMGTSDTAVARLESGFHLPSTDTLSRLADALGGRLSIEIVFDSRTEAATAPHAASARRVSRVNVV